MVLPVLFVGPFVLALFIMNKKLRDSVSIVFMFLIVFCICGPLTYGLLTDISLITDAEVFGTCDKSYSVFFVLFAFCHQQVLVSNALLIVLQNISVRFGIKKVSVGQTLTILILLLLYRFLLAAP